jgi:hypothetical protein
MLRWLGKPSLPSPNISQYRISPQQLWRERKRGQVFVVE